MKKIFLFTCILLLMAGCGNNNKLPKEPQSKEVDKADDIHMSKNIVVFSSAVLHFIKEYDVSANIFENSKLEKVDELSMKDIELLRTFNPETIFIDKVTKVNTQKIKDVAPIVYVDLKNKTLNEVKEEYRKLGNIFNVKKLVQYDILDIENSIKLIEENSNEIELGKFHEFIKKDDNNEPINSLDLYKKQIEKYAKLLK